jgi:hypothetical protein
VPVIEVVCLVESIQTMALCITYALFVSFKPRANLGMDTVVRLAVSAGNVGTDCTWRYQDSGNSLQAILILHPLSSVPPTTLPTA